VHDAAATANNILGSQTLEESSIVVDRPVLDDHAATS
jgi:hypothetical protein